MIPRRWSGSWLYSVCGGGLRLRKPQTYARWTLDWALCFALWLGWLGAGVVLGHGFSTHNLSELGTGLSITLLMPLYILILALLAEPFDLARSLDNPSLEAPLESPLYLALHRDFVTYGVIFLSSLLAVGLVIMATSPSQQEPQTSPESPVSTAPSAQPHSP